MGEIRFWVQRVHMQVGGHWEPPVDVCEDDEAYYIIVDVAGVDEKDLEVEYHPNGSLTVRGIRRPPVTGAIQCLVLEIPYGTFERRISLPKAIDAESIKAEYKTGLLLIRVPKKTPNERMRLLEIRS
ncbi:MAG: Hsp20/alpha crystallin family protein [Candidatus Fervidibacter sp.]|uniref:Hsp20/alpha crystallin family protein n=1 Tax=Candidatus Fervidibacter sp. TaxID=3100871 RepID=UPI0040497C51